ncbi:MAG: hypothetical protein HQ556_10670 [Candidatus Marinimicrobia bacterium]|nr:hypothetical protein [Candidatus Neomarinimicrobiota bacterium]
MGGATHYPNLFQSIDPSGENLYHVDYQVISRLNSEYGYSYFSESGHTNREDTIVDVIGIQKTVLKTGDMENLYSLRTIASFENHSSMSVENSEINHIAISPSGRGVAFVHRWYPERGHRKSRLLLGDSGGGAIRVLLDEGMISHYTWLNDDTLFAYGKHSGRAKFISISLGHAKVSIVEHEKLQTYGDGHPTYSQENGWLAIDTYPDSRRYQHLLLYQPKTMEVIPIGKFRSPFYFREQNRCDLHPRWNHDGRKLVIDTSNEGIRTIKILSIESILNIKYD